MDSRRLRALAHPVRVKLLGRLRQGGPSTATRLGEELGLASGATSYHLRQLAAAGLVAEDEERGNRRDRWWRATHGSTRFDNPDLWRDEPEAAGLYMQSVVGLLADRMQRFVAGAETRPPEWLNVGGLNDTMLRLTPQRAEQLTRAMEALVEGYRAESDAPADDAVDVFVQFHVMPEAGT
ncbi:hypothetical protein BIV57_20865 [Mangrovactinospora gilvigrisea]|uniref:HTH arsR-type domain-containing protein n=1 Tax=Mangrovactinospora gilvigrisea TaxID=1428644 RepID=A0A1J7C1Z4_9ACTN|nr:hypothetical protein BIV57_20865 [Mangrovactinospora gilvigrisea]